MKGLFQNWIIVLLMGVCLAAWSCGDSSSDEDADATSDPVAEGDTTDMTPDPEPDPVDDPTPDPTPDPTEDPTPDPVPDSTETYTVSGTVGRTVATCPPATDGLGTICLSIRTTCDDPGTEVASAEVADADMSYPTLTTLFEILLVPNGILKLFGFMDDDNGGCAEGIESGDFHIGASGCVDVTVDGADVTGLSVVFNGKEP